MKPDLSLTSTSTVSRRIVANTSLLLVAKVLATSLGALTLYIATQSLSAAAFGVVVFLHAYMLFFSEVATFQSWQAIIRFGTDDLMADDAESLSRLLKFGFLLDILGVVVGYVASLAFFGLVVFVAVDLLGIEQTDGVDIRELRRLAALYCLVILVRFTSTAIGVFRLFDKFVILAVEALVMPVIRLAGALIAAWQGWGLTGFLAAWFIASVCRYIFMWVAGAVELHRRGLLGPMLRARVRFFRPKRRLWPFVIKSNIDSTLATSFMNLPQLLTMAFFGPVWNGVFKIAEEVAKLLSEGFKLLDQVIYPELAKMIVDGRAEKIWRLVIRASAVLMSIGVTFSVIIFLFGRPVLTAIFGDVYADAVPLATLLVPAAALLGVAAPLYPIFYAANRPGRAALVRGSALCVYIATFVTLALTIGRMAPGWAALAANAFAVLVLLAVSKRTLKGAIGRQRRGL